MDGVERRDRALDALNGELEVSSGLFGKINWSWKADDSTRHGNSDHQHLSNTSQMNTHSYGYEKSIK